MEIKCNVTFNIKLESKLTRKLASRVLCDDV